MNTNLLQRLLSSVLCLPTAFLLAFAGNAGAAANYKVNNTDDLNLSTSWSTNSGSQTPNPGSIGSGDAAYFNEATMLGSKTVSLGGDLQLGGLALDYVTANNPNNLTINAGNTLTLNGATLYGNGKDGSGGSYSTAGIVLNRSTGGTMTLNCDIMVNSSQQWVSSRNLTLNGSVTVGTGSTLSFNVAGGTTALTGALKGGGAITKTGGSNFNLLGDGTDFTGSITNTSAQALALGLTTAKSAASVSSTGTGYLAIYSAGTTYINNINVSSTLGFRADYGDAGIKTVVINQTVDGAISSQIAQGTRVIAITKTGAATLTISSSSANHSGAIAVNEGTLKLGSAVALGSTSAGTTVASGAVLDLNGQTIGGEALVLNGTGISSGGAFINSSGTAASLSGGITLGSESSVGGSGDMTLSGSIGGTAGLTKTGNGTLTLSGANTYMGGTTISGGVLKLGNNNAPLGNNSGSVTINSGGTLDLNGYPSAGNNQYANSVSIAGTGSSSQGAYINNGTATVTSQIQFPSISLADNATIGGLGNFYMIASGYGASTLALGSHTLTKIGANTFNPVNVTITGAGTVDIEGGIFQLGNSSLSANASSASTTIFNLGNVSGATLALGTSATIGALQGGGATGGNVNLNANTLTVGGLDSSTVYGGVISGTGGLTKTGTGALTLSGANTYAGTTAISGGTLTLGNQNALQNSTLSYSAGTLVFDSSVLGGAFTFGGLSGSSAIALQNNAGTPVAVALTVGGNGAGTAYSGNLSGPGSLIKTGSGNLVLSGENSFVGPITVNNGYMVYASLTAEDNSTAIVLNGGNLALSGVFAGQTATIGSLSGNSTSSSINPNYDPNTGFKTLSVNQTVDGTYAGKIESGSGGRDMALMKTGSAKLTLSGVNTYGGDTTIDAGTLALGASGSFANTATIIVASGGVFDVSATPFTLGAAQTLKGGGSVVGTIINDGSITPGTSIDTLTFGAAPTLNSGGSITAEIDRNGGSPLADKIVVSSGMLTFGGTLTITNIGSTLQTADSFDLFDGSLSGNFGTLNLPGGIGHWNTTDLNSGGTITFTGNAVPIAPSFELSVNQGQTVTFTFAGSKFAITPDTDGDAVTVTGTGGSPTLGTPGSTATTVSYTSTGATGTDTFNYTVTDVLGATATGTVTVYVQAAEGFNKLSGPTAIGGGQYELNYLGVPGQNYALEETSDLPATGSSTWTPVVTNTASGTGAINYTTTLSYPLGSFRTRHVVP